MINVIDGDLLESNADIICHQVNCQGKMNSGIAKQIREKYPEVFNRYADLCSTFLFNKSELLGHCQVVDMPNGKAVANLFAQLEYGYDGKQYTNLDALKNAMTKLKDLYCSTSTVIAFPYGIGSVRGGAKFEDVYEIIENVFKDFTVELWRLDKG